MNARERFVRTMHFQEVDRAPWWEMWYWTETIERWQEEGLPKDVHLQEYFGVDRREGVGVNLGLIPSFEETTLEETTTYRIYIDGGGVTRKEFKEHGRATMPQWLRFPVQTRADFEKLKERLNPDSPCRYPLWWEDHKRYWKDRDYPLSISAGSLFGWIRNWMGFENVSVAMYDDPAFIRDMMEYLTEFVIATIHRALDEVDVDVAMFWEDMAYKTGPIISPAMFKEFMVPCYQRITSLLREHGVDIIFVDSDGDSGPLIPLWIEGGLNGFYPIEVAAGMDPVALRKQYGQDLLLIGGIDKRVLAKDRDAIEEEVMKKLPYLFSTGGYISWTDHLIPPDVPFENYLYYLKRMKEISLDPEKYL